jgi:catechol 2,3-dioxygenase-like lactoylglutathione lyase family enzyme
MEVDMASTDVSTEPTGRTLGTLGVDMNFEVVTLPVSDVERAKAFYERLGWRLDTDQNVSEDFRVVQFTPPHSGCSIHFGKGLTKAEPGSYDRMMLAVADVDATRDDLVRRGIDVGEVYQLDPPPGLQTEGRSYFAYASFRDPDGNTWLLQEVTTRIPGREWTD